jgi:transposase
VDEATRIRITELEGVVAAQSAEIAQLKQLVAKLLEEKGRNSRNSGKPPSSDPPAARAQRRAKGKKGERKRGGQPGHEGSSRALVPPGRVDHIEDLFPPECENCFASLPKTPDPNPRRYQTAELPPVEPEITEWRQHGVVCPCCAHKTYGPYDKIPTSPFGPRLSSIVALLTGVYHVSRRGTARLMSDLVGVEISLGAVSAIEKRVSESVKHAVDEVWAHVKGATVKHTDGTTWFKAGTMCALWTVATAMATAFKILANAKRDTLAALFGDKKRGILVSDRATALLFWAMERRQICWAHLLRKFISFSEKSGRGGVIGKELLEYVGVMFEYWDEMKTGKVTREELRKNMEPVRKNFEAALERAAVAAKVKGVSGSCADILEHRAALWTFVDRDDVDPTNNHAERELRAFVLWRKRSFGTQSERGDLFAERLMTVAHTARKQNIDVLAFLTSCCVAARDGSRKPSLFAA